MPWKPRQCWSLPILCSSSANKKLPGAKLGEFFWRHFFHRDAPEPNINIRIRFVLLVERRETGIQKVIDEFHSVAGLCEEIADFF